MCHLDVWFILVDSHGDPYDGNRKTCVSLPPVPNLDQFRKAVRKDYETTVLQNVPASRLQVYESKSALQSNDEYKNGNSSEILQCGPNDVFLVLVPVDNNSCKFENDL